MPTLYFIKKIFILYQRVKNSLLNLLNNFIFSYNFSKYSESEVALRPKTFSMSKEIPDCSP